MQTTNNKLLLRLYKNKALKSGKALDIGAGSGNDSLFLLEQNYSVIALEQKTDELIKNTRDRKNITIVQESMVSFDYSESEFDLIIANNSLPFITKEEFPVVLEKNIISLKKDGFFCFTLFGLEDEWSNKENMNFISYETAISFIKKFPVEFYFQSTEKGYGTTMKGDVKFWEIHKFIIKKKYYY